MIQTKSSSGRIVVTVPLYANSDFNSFATKLFNVSTVFYNSALNECERRRKAYRSDQNFKNAVDLFEKIKQESDKEVANKLKKDQNDLFNQAKINSGYYLRSSKHGKDDSIEQWSLSCIKSWLKEYIDAFLGLTLVKRAFNASERKGPKAKGKATKVKRKSLKFNPMLSVDAKCQKNAMRWDIEQGCLKITYGLKKTRKTINVFPLKKFQKDVNLDEKIGIIYSPDIDIKYVRLCRKIVRGSWRYFVQLICANEPVVKSGRVLGVGLGCLDLGVQTYAFLCGKEAKIGYLASGIDHLTLQKKVKKLQQKMSRSRFISNPQNYNENGSSKKGRFRWIKTKNYLKLKSRLEDLKRREKEHRKCLHGNLANYLRSKCDVLRLENVNTKAWQAKCGKSLGKKAPGLLMATLKQKFEGTGGRIEMVDTYKTALSKTCICGKRNKIKKRLYSCPDCGYTNQRDLHAAFMGFMLNDKHKHITAKALKKALIDKESIIRVAVKNLISDCPSNSLESYFGTKLELEEIAREGCLRKSRNLMQINV